MRVTDEEKEMLQGKYRQFIIEAAQAHDWAPAIIAAIMSRESRCGLLLIPELPGGNPAGTGDHGHGRSLMQIDDRSHEEFIDSGQWTDPRENILYGVKVLTDSFNYLSNHCSLEGADLEAAAIAGYNCGAGNVMKSLKEGKHWDARTANGDYSEDVLARSEELKELFPEA